MPATTDAPVFLITLTTGDGESRTTACDPHGSWACPFCSGVTVSPAGWADNEAATAASYAADGEHYEPRPYPDSEYVIWMARTCGNPMCLVTMNAGQCKIVRDARAEYAAEREALRVRHEQFEADLMERHDLMAAACSNARTRCEEHGFCYACWSHSTSAGFTTARERWVKHRRPANCPRAGR